MNQATGAIATPVRPTRLDQPAPERGLPTSGLPASGLPDGGLPDGGMSAGRLNSAWASILQSVTSSAGRTNHESPTITVDLAQDESVREFSTRLKMFILFMNRETGSVSATVSPSFQDDTYPAMLALVNGFHRSGADGEWRPDGPRAIRVGKASHLFVSVDMPVVDRSSAPDTLLEVVAAHRISASWYDQRVLPRVSSAGPGLTTVMFGVPGMTGVHGNSRPNSASSGFASSIFERERARNLSGRAGGVHFSRQSDWAAKAVV